MPDASVAGGSSPHRSPLMVAGWALEVTFSPQTPSPPDSRLVAHELTHVVQGGASVHGWDVRKRTATRRGVRLPWNLPGPGEASSYLPEVEDEVLLSFQSGEPRSSAVMFNPTELTINKDVNWASLAGESRVGHFRIVARKRGTAALTMVLLVGRSALRLF